jgi:hypothetical protein
MSFKPTNREPYEFCEQKCAHLGFGNCEKSNEKGN